jgi:hypothetical protein
LWLVLELATSALLAIALSDKQLLFVLALQRAQSSVSGKLS